MSSTNPWKPVHTDQDAHVRIFKVIADTHEELGQRLLADPLSVLLGKGLVDSDEGWRVQLQVVNADIPSGPLPLPDEIPKEAAGIHLPPWVIRKHVVIITICDDLQLVVMLVCRFATTRAKALDVLEKSLEHRRSQKWGPH
jgi:hypothetical protein